MLSTTETTPDRLIPACEEVRDFFGQQIAPLSWDEHYPVSEMAWQSIQTEMHKQIKLLVTETTFYQMSRQASAKQQRKNKIANYTQTLIRYCEILLGAGD